MKYVLVLAAIPAVFGFLGMLFSGHYFWRTLGGSITAYVATLVSILIGAFIVEQLAPKFEGKTDFNMAARLLAFSAVPGFAAGILRIFPSVPIATIAALISLYGLYVYLVGIPTMTSVPEARKVGFFFVSILLMIVAGAILFAVIAALVPNLHQAQPEVVETVGSKEVGQVLDAIKQLIPPEAAQ